MPHATPPDAAAIDDLHHRAHGACYIANSIRAEVKIEPRQAEAFLKKPDPRIRGVVIYGNDDGLVAERAVALAKSICDDLNDPFRVVDIAGEVLKHDPARLADEFGALSMMGGRRVIRVRYWRRWH